MTDEKRKRFLWYRWTFAGAMVLVVYILSAGPALMLCGHGPSFKQINQIYQMFYAPLIWWASVNCPESVWVWFDWYFRLWRAVP